ncbi:hypothetical protein D9M73_210830 [compost metagenome]
MNIDNLLGIEHFDPTPRPFKTLGQVFTGLILAIRLQLDDMEMLLLGTDLLQPGDQ